MIAQELEISLQNAFVKARQQRHQYITVEHLLDAMLDNPSAVAVLDACGCNIEALRATLKVFLDQASVPVPGTDDVDTQPTLGFQRVIQRAIMQVQSSNQRREVVGANVLVALFGEKDSDAVYYLNQQGVTRLDAVNYLAHGVRKNGETDVDKSTEGADDSGDRYESGNLDPLTLYALNLNKLAADGRVDPLIGREIEVERIIHILARRRKNNPLLIGDSGVGKTAIAEGIAFRIVKGDVPEILADNVIYSLDIGAMMAGTKYRGDFEQRLKGILKRMKEMPNAILFIDEIHTIIGAGAASGGSMDVSNLIKPALANGQLRCFGATTYTEYRTIFEKDNALSRRFQKVEVLEPTVEQSIQILKGLKSKFEEYHGVQYSHDALTSAVELSDRFINDRQLPDKAIDIIDEAGAAERVLPVSQRKKVIRRDAIEIVVSRIARIPLQAVSADDRSKLRTMERDLKNVVFGQDKAADAVVSAIKMARSGLGKVDKPIGSFLFSGPTGVGKTEIAKQLAFILGVDLVRFDMSEYMERHTISRLIGSPPGYTGFDKGGLLTEEINKKPHCVLLLDEIEKAHPDIFNILLQVMDHGTLTDANGRKSDFRNVILIMTTNAGADTLSRKPIGFGGVNALGDDMVDIKKTFTPEFRNRLDSIIQFEHLSESIIMRVVDKFLMDLEHQLQALKVDATFSSDLKKHLAKKGFDPIMGARPMLRLIQDLVRRALADELLFGRLVDGGTVFVDIDDAEDIQLTFSEELPVEISCSE